MELFARQPVEDVTVQDIAAAVNVTPAAVYYHFASKEQILLEGMQQFRHDMVDFIRERLADEEAGVHELVTEILTWVAQHRTPAKVYYVRSIGLNLVVEALRRESRVELIDVTRDAVRRARGRSNAAETGVVAVGLVSLVETAIASMLNEDEAYMSIGRERFAGEVAAIATRIAAPND